MGGEHRAMEGVSLTLNLPPWVGRGGFEIDNITP